MSSQTQLVEWLSLIMEGAVSETLEKAGKRLGKLADQTKLWIGPGLLVANNLPDYPEPP